MNFFRRLLHALLNTAAAFFWTIAASFLYLSFGLIVLAAKVWPTATWGNCWSYTAPLWIRNGGYLCVRWADHVRFLRYLKIPHAIWIHTLSTDSVLRQTRPVHRSHSTLAPWTVFYHKFIVSKKESPHNSPVQLELDLEDEHVPHN